MTATCKDFKEGVLDARCGQPAPHKLLDLDLCDTHMARRGRALLDNPPGQTVSVVPPVATEIEPDHDVIVGFNLIVTGFGKTEPVTRDIAKTICMLLHRAFDDERWALRLEDGRWIEYDHLAADGEHDDHELILRIKQEQ